jgi:hypothetical protein
MATLSSINALSSVLLPALGRPTNATVPERLASDPNPDPDPEDMIA